MELKRHYRRQQDLREMLINEGVQMLLEADPAERDVVTFARVFERIERAGYARVTKGSVLGPGRAWASQRDFQLDVEAATARALADIDVELAATLAAAGEVLAHADLATRVGRARAVQQLCRVAGEAYFVQLTSEKTWRLWIGLWARAASTADTGERRGIGAALKRAQTEATTQLIGAVYAPLAELVGYRGRSEFGSTDDALSHLAVAVMGVADGLALRQRLAPEDFVLIGRPTGPNGEREPWHPYAIALEALVNQFLEPAPRRTRHRPKA
jgi:hypothetical protein